ncbi:hypothetical protein SDC9_169187 [bioreactor metagenome]|uniref:Rod shape-determining protein MreD n=1 Tax=bioreactor metagenome TaxID=1076179 RepID=A0A645G577_9ZZZZ
MIKRGDLFNKSAYYGILILGVFLLQSTLGDIIRIKGIAPNLLFCIIICAGAFESELFATIISFASGFVVDSYSERIFGLILMLYTVGGYINAHLFKAYIRLSLQNICVMTMACVFLYELFVYMAFFFTAFNASFGMTVVTKMLPAALYSGVAVVPFFFVARFVNRQTVDEEEKEF